jgi:hypothetical protein
MKFNLLILSILIFLIINKAHAVDVEFTDGSIITGVLPGQLQNIEFSSMRHVIFYPQEFSFFSDYQTSNNVFRFYGHPGSIPLGGYELSGNLSSYQYLISRDLNQGPSAKSAYSNWFNQLPSEPYPTVEQPETVPPIISLLGSTTVYLVESESFNDSGATAYDQIDGDLTSNITISGSININVIGTYSISYNVSDSDGNAAETVFRTVIVNSADVQNISTDQLEKLIVTIALTAFALAGFTTGMTYRFDS